MDSLHDLTRPLLCIVGPTASGKSELAQLVAERINAEIISADSMQIYKKMDIGTGKVLPKDQRVTHYGLGIVEPGVAYSAALFQRYSREIIEDISSRGKTAIVCGGTGLYVRACVDDYDFPQSNSSESVTRFLMSSYEERFGNQALWDLLHTFDPESALCIHPHNTRRVIRAFELLEEGVHYASQKENLHSLKQFYPAVFVGLTMDRALLYEKINLRVDAMVEAGLINEVKALLESGYVDAVTSSQAIGYKEIYAALEGQCSFSEAIEQIKQSTRRYAKRQISWFRSDSRINWIDPTQKTPAEVASEVVSLYRASL